jgi:hypothetical protein
MNLILGLIAFGCGVWFVRNIVAILGFVSDSRSLSYPHRVKGIADH